MDKFIVEGRFRLPERVDTQVICDLMMNDIMDAEDKTARLGIFLQTLDDAAKILSMRADLFKEG